MITIIILILIYCVYSTHNIYKNSGSWKEWNPYDADNAFIFIGGVVSMIVLLILTIPLIYFIVEYLP